MSGVGSITEIENINRLVLLGILVGEVDKFLLDAIEIDRYVDIK